MRSPLWKWLPGFLGNLCLLPLFGTLFLLLPSAMTSGWVTHHPGSYLTHPGSSFLALTLPCCLPLGGKEQQELMPQTGRPGLWLTGMSPSRPSASTGCHQPFIRLMVRAKRDVLLSTVTAPTHVGPPFVVRACTRQLNFFLQENIPVNISAHSFQ